MHSRRPAGKENGEAMKEFSGLIRTINMWCKIPDKNYEMRLYGRRVCLCIDTDGDQYLSGRMVRRRGHWDIGFARWGLAGDYDAWWEAWELSKSVGLAERLEKKGARL